MKNVLFILTIALIAQACDIIGGGEITDERKLKKEIVGKWNLFEICDEETGECSEAASGAYWEFGEDGSAKSGNQDGERVAEGYSITDNTLTISWDWGDEVYEISIGGNTLNFMSGVRTYKFEKE